MEAHLREETSLAEVIQEEDFRPILERAVRNFVATGRFFLDCERELITKRVIGHVNEEAELLESFLDDYDARYNRSFSNLTEIVASIRNLIGVCYTLRHVRRRYFKYHLDDDVAQLALFHLRSGEAFEFITDSVCDLIRASLTEAEAVGLAIPDDKLDLKKLTDALPRSHLPHNLGEETAGDVDKQILEITNAYLRAAQAIEGIGTIADDADPDTVRRFVTENLPEERCRELEAAVHGLQSKYDTYLKNTDVENATPLLKKLRGHVSMALHLLEFTTGLVHFYERHENDIRSVDAKRRIARVVDKNEILRLIATYGFQFARHYITRGRAYAEALQQEYSEMVSLELDLPEGVYLHARPVSLIVGVVQHHGAPVDMEIEGEKVQANSIIQVLMVSGANPDARRVTFSGEEKPLADIRALFEAKLGEDGLDTLPPQLDYLR